jgi:hypothetical protein
LFYASSLSAPVQHMKNYKLYLTGGNKNMSASERWRRKKDGEGDHSKEENRQQVTELTELANRLLTRTGNMNIYQEGYEHITMLVGIVSTLLGGGGGGSMCWLLFIPKYVKCTVV